MEQAEMRGSSDRGVLEWTLMQNHGAITAWDSGVRNIFDGKKLSKQLVELLSNGLKSCVSVLGK